MKRFYIASLLIVTSLLLGCSLTINAQTSTFVYTGAIQTYSVPSSVTSIGILATGAQGGNSSYYNGGFGASMYGVFTVIPGHVLSILIGQQPASVTYVGGGGGGTFVWDNASTALPLIAAGGGGGGGYSGSGTSANASTTTSGTAGVGGGGGGGTAGSGGSAPSASYYAAGGAGWLSNGAGAYISGVGCSLATGGTKPLSGGAGGNYGGTSGEDGNGGFGGGGGGQGQCGATGGGGGGGYSGGGAGVYTSTFYGGGGGGSYNGGTGQINSILSSTGNGQVVITVLCNAPGTITGNHAICQGSTFTLSDATGLPGGTWSSGNTAVATIDPSLGIVTGVSAGTAIVTYNIINPCGALATAVVTVNPLPAAITGVPSVCTGSTITLSETTTGGTWSSISTSTATVDGSGDVTGGGAGATSIVYTLPTTCTASFPVIVNSAPGSIIGTASVCVGNTTSLSDVVSGGTWSTTAGTIASVSSGIVGGIASGVSDIMYTLPSGCFAATYVTVNGLPTPYLVLGSTGYCAGSSDTVTIKLEPTAAGVSYQVYNGTTAIGSPITGTGGEIYFPAPSGPGTYTVVGTNSNGCMNTMNLSAVVTQKALPTPYIVTGGGPICTGGSVADSLSESTVGVSYKLILNDVDTLETIGGTGFPLSFGAQSSSGSYTVVAYTGGTPNCSIKMIDSASISINSLPDVETVTGGGTYCSGGTGVVVGLAYSEPGISYQLYNGGDTSGYPVTGIGDSLSFGLQTTPGASYSVVATNLTTGCVNEMAGTVSVGVAAPPAIYDVTVTGDPTGCVGSSFPVIGLDWSDAGVNYQLYDGASPVGSAVPGAIGAIEFGVVTDSGSYTVIATDQTYFCTSAMNDTAYIDLSPLPNIYNVTGGGSYCASGVGLPVLLNGSQDGVLYTLTASTGGSYSLAGDGGPLNFGDWSGPGSYTVSAVDSITGCSSNMAGSAVININPLPIAYNTLGGGAYCAGGTGRDISIAFSTIGVNYQLYNGAGAVGAAIAGTGDTLNLGYHTPAGTYTIVGTNASTGCVANMSGSATVIINPLPPLHIVSGGGSYCSGGAGLPVNMNGSDLGMSYQLYDGMIPVGSAVAGTGAAINFGLQTLGGAYSVVATDTLTQCTQNMTGVVTIVVNATPTAYTVTGGGLYCAGTTGVHIGLSGSNAGVHYLLYNGGVLETTMTGTGASVDFGVSTMPGTYTVLASNTATGCNNNMTGDAIVDTNTLPTVYPVIGGGSYCAGSTPVPSVGLSGSDAGVNYQLYHGTASSGAAIGGTGAALDFGSAAAAGTYTIIATNATTGCTKNMGGSASVIVNPQPSVYTVTGGGSYCAGGTGYHVYMSITNPGTDYILYQGATIVDTVTGSGAGADFGLQTAAGTYTATAVNLSTGCMSNMAGSAVIAVNPLPAVHTVTVADGGNYCASGSGVAVGLDGSNSGINYQLYNGTVTTGTPVGGSGSAIAFGLHTAGDYTIVATNATTGCKSTMTGSAMVNAIPLPNVYATTGGGNYCTTGLGLHIGLSSSDSGTQYQLYHGASPVGSPVTGATGALDFGLFTGAGTYTIVGTNGGALGCSNNMSGSAVITVYPVIIPTVTLEAAGGDTACAGITDHFTAVPVNGGPAPTYSWSVNGTTAPTTGSTYSYIPASGDVVKVILHSNAICAIPDTVSQAVTMSVSIPEAPSVSIMASPGDKVCQGAPVTFTGTSMYGGSHPAFTWVKNSIYVVGSGPTFTYTPANGDIIVLLMGSDFPCRLLDSVFSNTITLEVDSPVVPTVGIIAIPGTQVAVDQSVTLTATVANGGATPTYQWVINGTPVSGATNASFTSTHFVNGDSVTCEVVGGCAGTGAYSVVMHVGAEGVQQIAGNGSDNIKLVPNPNNGTFTVKGTLANVTDEEVAIEVVNMLGQVVYSDKVMTQNGTINKQIQLSSSLANGMYLLNVKSGSQNTVLHFVIEQ